MPTDDLKGTLARVLAPLIESDQGELFLVRVTDQTVSLHLRGRFAGCPGNGLVTDQIIAPVVRALLPEARVEVTSGAILPEGALKISASTLSTSTTESENAAV